MAANSTPLRITDYRPAQLYVVSLARHELGATADHKNRAVSLVAAPDGWPHRHKTRGTCSRQTLGGRFYCERTRNRSIAPDPTALVFSTLLQCCLAFNPAAKGLLAAGSTDKLVRLWDFADLPADGGKVEQPLALKDVRCGGVFSAGWIRDAPYLLAAGGSKGEATVWDLRCEEEDVKRRIPR